MGNNQQSSASAGEARDLPKNFRQIGEPGNKKIYMEDYVFTYLSKLAKPGNIYARGAILFGKTCRTPRGKCLFISGAAACQKFELDLETTAFTEENWQEIYRTRDKYFPGCDVCGWFLSRMGFSVELNDKIIRIHIDNFNGEDKVLYMIDALEGEDAFYQFENYSLKKQGGYYIYYETNEAMKEYMLAEGEMEAQPEPGRASRALTRDASVVKNYKKALKEKKSLRRKPEKKLSPSALAAGLAILVAGVYFFHAVQVRDAAETVAVFGEQEGSTAFSASAEAGTEDASAAMGVGESTENAGEASTDSGYDFSKDAAGETSGTEEDSDLTGIFTQEEPDDVTEAWSYIGGSYVVKEGDTLAAISKEIYESYDYVSLIADANDIENVDQIYPGQVLTIPQIED